MTARTRFPVVWTDEAIPQPLTDGNGDSLSNDIVLSNTTNELVLEVTMQQYTDLLSAAYNGAQQAFPDRYLEVLYPLIKAGKLSFCDEVANCIDGNTTVQLSITNILNNNGSVNPNSIDPNTTTGNDRLPNASTESVSNDPPSCDRDALWSGIREMVERVDQNGRDILEDLAVLNDKVEQLAEVIDLVPLLGDTIKDIADFFTATVPDLLNAYNAASSPTFLDNVACDLFEMVCNQCRYPTFDEIIQYFGDHSYFALPAFSTVTYAVLWDLIKTVTGVTPEALWYSINVWQCITLAFDGTFNRSYGKKSFAIWCSFGEDNPNDNWTVLCNGCSDTWCNYFNFLTAQYQWSVQNDPTYNNPVGTYTANGFVSVAQAPQSQPSAVNETFGIEVIFVNPVTLTDIFLDFNILVAFPQNIKQVSLINASEQVIHTFGITGAVGDNSWSAQAFNYSDVKKIIVRLDSTNENIVVTMKNIELRGIGIDPEYGVGC